MFDFSTFPILTTERLILREVVAADAPDVFIFRSDPEVQKRLNLSPDQVRKLQNLQSQYDTQFRQFSTGGTGGTSNREDMMNRWQQFQRQTGTRPIVPLKSGRTLIFHSIDASRSTQS